MVLGSKLFDQGRHPHPLANEACFCLIHGRQELTTGVVYTRQLPQVHFHLFVWTQQRTPGMFGLADPWPFEPAREFQPAYRAEIVNRDA